MTLRFIGILWPHSVLPRCQDTLRVQRILDLLVHFHLYDIIEVVRICTLIHNGNMGPWCFIDSRMRQCLYASLSCISSDEQKALQPLRHPPRPRIYACAPACIVEFGYGLTLYLLFSEQRPAQRCVVSEQRISRPMPPNCPIQQNQAGQQTALLTASPRYPLY